VVLPSGRALPTTVRGTPSTVSVRPTAAESDRKRRCQYALLMSTAGAPPGRSSSAKKLRPAMGLIPSAGRNSRDASAAETLSGSPVPLTLSPYSGIANAAAIWSNELACAFQSR